MSIPAAATNEKPFLLAGLALTVLVLGSATLLGALTGARRQEALR